MKINYKPNLDRFYNACTDFAVTWHREMSTFSTGEQLCATTARPAEYDTMEKLWNYANFSLNTVRLILSLEYTALVNQLQEEQVQLQAEMQELLQQEDELVLPNELFQED